MNHGLLQLYGVLARKKDGKLAYKLAIVSQDFSLALVHKNGGSLLPALVLNILLSLYCEIILIYLLIVFHT